MKKHLIIILWATTFNVISQEAFLDVPNTLKTTSHFVKDAFAVVNDVDETFAIFIQDTKSINGYLYTWDLEPLGSYASEGLSSKFDEVIGQTVKGNQIQLFLKSANNKKFGSILFDFDRQSSIETEFDFKLKKEFFLQSYSTQDGMYMFAVEQEQSVINAYLFDHDGSYEKIPIDLTQQRFRNYRNQPCGLYELMTGEIGRGAITAAKIDESTPNALEVTSERSKFYGRDNSFVLTLDQSSVYTYHIEVNLSDMTSEFKAFLKPRLQDLTKKAKSNSFLSDQKLFQINSSAEELKMTVTDIATDEQIKQLDLGKDDEITFKNSPIIIEGGFYNSKRVREMEKTHKFLRKINQDDIGIAVLSRDNGYQITLGGKQDLNKGGGMMMGMGIPVFSSGNFTFFFNPTFFAYSAYSSSKSIRIECLFDDNFQHLDGDIQPNVFDEIKLFSESIKSPKAENVFKLDSDFLYGNYEKKTHTYQLTKFEN